GSIDVTVSWTNRTPGLSIAPYGSRTESRAVRPNITSSFEYPKTNESALSIRTTSTWSRAPSERRVASSKPPNPAPAITTRIARVYAAQCFAHQRTEVRFAEHDDFGRCLLGGRCGRRRQSR